MNQRFVIIIMLFLGVIFGREMYGHTPEKTTDRFTQNFKENHSDFSGKFNLASPNGKLFASRAPLFLPGEEPKDSTIVISDCSGVCPLATTTTLDGGSYPSAIALGFDFNVGCQGIFEAPRRNQVADICGGTVKLRLLSLIHGTNSCSKTITFEWEVSDDCGNLEVMDQVFTIVDDIAPVLTQTANSTYNVSCGTMVDRPTAEDACQGTLPYRRGTPNSSSIRGLYSRDITRFSVTCANSTTIMRTWIAADGCGNLSAPFVQTINYNDTNGPTFTIPSNVTTDQGLECSSDDDFDPQFLASLNSDWGFPKNVRDDCQASESSISANYVNGNNSWMTAGGYTISFSDNTPCSDPDYCTAANGFKLRYKIERTWTVTDRCQNTSTPIVQTINITDNTAPVITGSTNLGTVAITAVGGACPNDVNIFSQSSNAPAIPSTFHYDGNNLLVTDPGSNTLVGTFTPPTATDMCNGIGTTVCPDDAILSIRSAVVNDKSNAPCQVRYAVLWEAEDSCGNKTSIGNPFRQFITFSDELAPQWTLAQGSLDQTIDCTNNIEPTIAGNGGAGLAPDVNDVDETCGITANYRLTLMVPPTGSAQGFYYMNGAISNCTANEKVLIRAWYAVDTCGNVSTAFEQEITIQDNSTPDFVQPISPVNLFTSTGNICPAGNDPEGMVSLAEGQTVTSGMAFTVAGVNFNAPIFSVTPTNAGEYGGLCDANAVLVLEDINVVGTMTNCGFDLELVWKVTDDCGNSISRTQIFSVKDNTAPTVTSAARIDHIISSPQGACPSDFSPSDFDFDAITKEVVITDPASGTVTRYAGIPTFVDNCQAVNISFSIVLLTPRNCDTEFLISWNADDGCGNATSTVVQEIRIREIVRPRTSGLSSDDIVNACAQTADKSFFNYAYDPVSGNGTLTYDDGSNPINLAGVGAAHFIENCELASVSLTTDSPMLVSGDMCESVFSLIYTARDSCNNEPIPDRRHTQIITIKDTEGPVFTSFPPDDATLECLPDTSFYMSFVTAVDNCMGTPVNFIKVTDVVTNAGTGCGSDPIVVERTYTIEDVCGNTTDSTQMLVIEDDKAPILVDTIADMTTCPGMPTPDYSLIIANDGNNCVSKLTYTSIDVITQNGTACLGDPRVTERTFRVEDECGNFSEFVQTITEIDEEEPTFTPPADEVFYYDENCSVAFAFSFPTNLSDNCGTPTYRFTDAFLSNPVDLNIIINRTFTITDGCFFVTHVQSIRAADTISPIIVVNSEFVDCDNANLNTWLESPTIADNCNVVTSGNNYLGFAPTCGSAGVYTYEFFAIDDNGNTSTPVIRTYTVNDNDGPTFNNMPANLTVSCGASTEPLDLNGIATITDGCDPAPHIEYDDSRSFPGCPDFIEVIVRTWTASDHCGNETTYVQTINIEDDGAPVINCPADITIACDDTPSFSFTGQATASDNCQGLIIPTFTDVDVTADCIKTITRTWTATDNCGNSSSCDQEIVLEDNQLPEVLNAPISMTVECDGLGNIVERFDWLDDFGGAVVTDDCGTVEIIHYLQISNSKMQFQCEACFAYIFWAKDGCSPDSILVGEASFCIEDTTPPAFDTLATDIIVECDGSGNMADLNSWLNNYGGARATETCSEVIWENEILTASTTCAMTSVTTYQFSAKDSCGQEVLTTADFIITDTTVPTWVNEPVDTVVNCDGNGNADDLAAWLSKWSNMDNASDECSSVMITSDLKETINPDSCLGQASYEYQFVAEDECGNKNARTVVFQILDLDGPTISCPADIVVNCTDDSTPNALGFATGFDACSFSNSATFVDSMVLKPCPNVENIYRKWTVMDACGNGTTCQQLIERRDMEAPVFTSQPTSVINEYISDAFGGCHENIQFGSIENPSGNCWEITFEVSDANGNMIGELVYPGPCVEDDCSNVFLLPTTINKISVDNCSRRLGIIWTFTDSCDNRINFSQTYNFFDQAAPQWTVPNPFIISGTCTDDIDLLLAANMPTIEENCDGIITETNRDTIDSGCIQTHIVMYQTMDSCGNVNPTLLQVRIDVSDTEDPVWATTLPSNNMKVECDGSGNAGQLGAWLTLWENTNNASDGCGDIEIEADLGNYFPGSCSGTGLWVYDFIVTDDCGNSSLRTGTFTIEDSTKPTITFCPPMATVDCGENTDPNTLGNATALDNCSAFTNITYNDVSISANCPEPIQTITRTWRATDACGNFETCEQSIQVIDNEQPNIINGADDELIALTSLSGACNGISTGAGSPGIFVDFVGMDGSQCSKIVFNGYDTNGNLFQVWNIDGPCAIDDCAGIDFDAVITPSINGCMTTFAVAWTITDACGNEIQDAQDITFRDGVTPTWTSSTSVVVNSDCSQPIDDVILNNRPTALDNCAVIYNVESDITTNQGACSGIYTRTIMYSISDDCGNTNPTNGSLTINVNDTTAPTFTTAPRDTTFACGTNNVLGKVDDWASNFAGATVMDNCGNATRSYRREYILDFCGGADEFKYWFIAEDECGNRDSMAAFFRTIDTIAPVFTVQPQNLTVQCDGIGNVTALNNWLSNGAGAQAVDECYFTIEWDSRLIDTKSTSCSEAEFTYEIIAHDRCGNADTTTAIFTVEDNLAPIFINPPADTTIACNAPIPSPANVTAVDCDTNLAMSMTENVTPINAGGIKELITRVWVAVDCHNRVSTHTQVITVESDATPTSQFCPLDPGPFTSQNGNCVNVTWTEPIFSGTNLTITKTHSSGDCFDVGITRVTYSATDNSGRTVTCSFDVEVNLSCIPPANANSQNFIDRIAINSIVNQSGNDNAYGNYKNLSTTLFSGSNYFMTLNPGGPAGTGVNAAGFWRVWIDWNGDGIFSEPSERVVQTAGQGLMIANLNIPNNPILGTKCMRVSFHHFNFPQPCDDMADGFGEVEDYTVHIVRPLLLVDDASGENTIAVNDENITTGNYGFIAKSNGELVDLNWTVAENDAVDYFNIERSKDGINFHKLLTINSLETTTGELFYKAKDKKPMNGDNYYRLIQVLKNGETIVSKVQKVTFEDTAFHVELYPNPTDGMLQIRQSDFVDKVVNISIMNNLAQRVQGFKFEKMEPVTTIDLSDLPDGVYNIIIQSGEFVTVEQVILQK